MPISWAVDPEKRIVFSTWVGDISIADLRKHWAAVLSDPQARAVARTVADLREATLNFSGAELMQAVHEVALPALAGLAWKNALVVARPDQYGVSRQFQVFSEAVSRDAIFEDPASAVQWVLDQ